jgi:hypothetical protein
VIAWPNGKDTGAVCCLLSGSVGWRLLCTAETAAPLTTRNTSLETGDRCVNKSGYTAGACTAPASLTATIITISRRRRTRPACWRARCFPAACCLGATSQRRSVCRVCVGVTGWEAATQQHTAHHISGSTPPTICIPRPWREWGRGEWCAATAQTSRAGVGVGAGDTKQGRCWQGGCEAEG